MSKADVKTADIPVVILAGGRGTRLMEETQVIPKPMVTIGGKPILWHLMMTYSHFGFRKFIVCLGYKGYVIKDYFLNVLKHTSSVTVKSRTGEFTYDAEKAPDWELSSRRRVNFKRCFSIFAFPPPSSERIVRSLTV